MTNVRQLLIDAKYASSSLRNSSGGQRASILRVLANGLIAATNDIIRANCADLAKMDDTDPKRDRLLLNERRIRDLSESLVVIASLPDPSGQVLVETTHSNGVKIQKVTVPLGVVGVIYESRPNVTVDVAALCIRSGNACVLRGGSDAHHTNTVLVDVIRSALVTSGVDINAVQIFPPQREHIAEMLTAVKDVDIIIPRGSQELIEFVRKNSLVPVIETGAGVCHTYVEKTANLEKASGIVLNAKVSRPSVCNALDTIILDHSIAQAFLEIAAPRLAEWNVEVFADQASFGILEKLNYPCLSRASAEDYGREFLDYKCSVRVVDGPDEALEHITMYSSRHSEAILTEDQAIGERFLSEVDAAAVYLNASTRFTDGSVFGLGAEIGISTQKLHARGPFALEKLVTEKWIVRGDGQIRE